MIAPAKPLRPVTPRWHRPFLAMLPTIRRYARGAFGHLNPESREDAVEDTIANTLVAFLRLVETGKAHKAFPTVLAHYAISQVREGRRVGGRLRIREVLSRYAQRRKQFFVERLDRRDEESGEWLEVVVEDRRTPVPDQVAFLIDFPGWLRRLGRRNGRIAKALAVGHTTGEVAQRFHLSPARVSQLRAQFYQSWQNYHGDAAAAAI